MNFYNREREIQAMANTRKFAFEEHSMLTVITGRCRISKTSLNYEKL